MDRPPSRRWWQQDHGLDLRCAGEDAEAEERFLAVRTKLALLTH